MTYECYLIWYPDHIRVLEKNVQSKRYVRIHEYLPYESLSELTSFMRNPKELIKKTEIWTTWLSHIRYPFSKLIFFLPEAVAITPTKKSVIQKHLWNLLFAFPFYKLPKSHALETVLNQFMIVFAPWIPFTECKGEREDNEFVLVDDENVFEMVQLEHKQLTDRIQTDYFGVSGPPSLKNHPKSWFGLLTNVSVPSACLKHIQYKGIPKQFWVSGKGKQESYLIPHVFSPIVDVAAMKPKGIYKFSKIYSCLSEELHVSLIRMFITEENDTLICLTEENKHLWENVCRLTVPNPMHSSPILLKMIFSLLTHSIDVFVFSCSSDPRSTQTQSFSDLVHHEHLTLDA